MSANATQAIEALTRSVHELAQSIATKGPEWMTAYSTLILALLTFILAVAAVWSARDARKAAEASKDMVAIERERLREADRPEVAIRVICPAGQGDAPNDQVMVDLLSTGPGQLEIIDCFSICEVEGRMKRYHPHHFPPQQERVLGPKPQGRYEAAGQVTATFLLPRGRKREIIICRYTDVYHSAKEPRVYHSIYDSAYFKCLQRYYRWNQEVPAEYRDACRAWDKHKT